MDFLEDEFSDTIGFKLNTDGKGIKIFKEKIDINLIKNKELNLFEISKNNKYFACSNGHTLIIDCVSKFSNLNTNDLKTFKVVNLTQIFFSNNDEVLFLLENNKLKYIDLLNYFNTKSFELNDYILDDPNFDDVKLISPSSIFSSLLLVQNSKNDLFLIKEKKIIKLSQNVAFFSWSIKGETIYYSSYDSLNVKSLNLIEIVSKEIEIDYLLEGPFFTNKKSWTLSFLKEIYYNTLIIAYHEKYSDSEPKIFLFLLEKKNSDYVLKNIDIMFSDEFEKKKNTFYFSSFIVTNIDNKYQFFTSSMLSCFYILKIENNFVKMIQQLEDSEKAQFPLDDETYDDTFPVGMSLSIDHTNTNNPTIFLNCLFDTGSMVSWEFFNKKETFDNYLEFKENLNNSPMKLNFLKIIDFFENKTEVSYNSTIYDLKKKNKDLAPIGNEDPFKSQSLNSFIKKENSQNHVNFFSNNVNSFSKEINLNSNNNSSAVFGSLGFDSFNQNKKDRLKKNDSNCISSLFENYANNSSLQNNSKSHKNVFNHCNIGDPSPFSNLNKNSKNDIFENKDVTKDSTPFAILNKNNKKSIFENNVKLNDSTSFFSKFNQSTNNNIFSTKNTLNTSDDNVSVLDKSDKSYTFPDSTLNKNLINLNNQNDTNVLTSSTINNQESVNDLNGSINFFANSNNKNSNVNNQKNTLGLFFPTKKDQNSMIINNVTNNFFENLDTKKDNIIFDDHKNTISSFSSEGLNENIKDEQNKSLDFFSKLNLNSKNTIDDQKPTNVFSSFKNFNQNNEKEVQLKDSNLFQNKTLNVFKSLDVFNNVESSTNPIQTSINNDIEVLKNSSLNKNGKNYTFGNSDKNVEFSLLETSDQKNKTGGNFIKSKNIPNNNYLNLNDVENKIEIQSCSFLKNSEAKSLLSTNILNPSLENNSDKLLFNQNKNFKELDYTSKTDFKLKEEKLKNTSNNAFFNNNKKENLFSNSIQNFTINNESGEASKNFTCKDKKASSLSLITNDQKICFPKNNQNKNICNIFSVSDEKKDNENNEKKKIDFKKFFQFFYLNDCTSKNLFSNNQISHNISNICTKTISHLDILEMNFQNLTDLMTIQMSNKEIFIPSSGDSDFSFLNIEYFNNIFKSKAFLTEKSKLIVSKLNKNKSCLIELEKSLESSHVQRIFIDKLLTNLFVHKDKSHDSKLEWKQLDFQSFLLRSKIRKKLVNLKTLENELSSIIMALKSNCVLDDYFIKNIKKIIYHFNLDIFKKNESIDLLTTNLSGLSDSNLLNSKVTEVDLKINFNHQIQYNKWQLVQLLNTQPNNVIIL